MKITDERLAEMVGAGVPCVPAQPGEVAAVAQELRALRAASIPAPERSKEGVLRVKAEDGPALQQVMGRFQIYLEMAPEEDETWESWYYAAIDMLRSEVREILSALETRDAVGYVSERSFGYLKSGQINGAAMIEPTKTRLATIPLYAAPVPVPVTITDEMANAAIARSKQKDLDLLTNTEAMRQIIAAALSQKPGEQG